MVAQVLGVGAIAGAHVARGALEATGEIVGGIAQGLGSAAGGMASGVGSAVSGIASGIGNAVSGALQGAMTPPDVVVNNFQVDGVDDSKELSSGGVKSTAPKAGRKTREKVDKNKGSDELLVLAVERLHSIENTIIAEMLFEEEEAKRKALEERENKIEAKKKQSLTSSKSSDIAEKIKKSSKKNAGALSRGLLLGAAVLTPFYLAGLEDGQITRMTESIRGFLDNLTTVIDRFSGLTDMLSAPFDLMTNLLVGGDPEEMAKNILEEMGITRTNMEDLYGGSVNVGRGAATAGLNDEQRSVADRVYNYLKNNSDLSDAQIAGIMGNIMRESSFNPNAGFDTPGAAAGLIQWDDRRPALEAWARENGLDPRDPITQMRFMLHEGQTTEASAWNAFKETTNAADAAEVFMRRFERPAEETSGLDVRISTAQAFMGEGSSRTPGFNMPNINVPNMPPSIREFTGDTLNTLAQGVNRLIDWDTTYRPLGTPDAAEREARTQAMNRESSDLSVAETTIGLTEAYRRMSEIQGTPSYEDQLRMANGGTLDVIDPNYDTSGEGVAQAYVQFFGLDK